MCHWWTPLLYGWLVQNVYHTMLQNRTHTHTGVDLAAADVASWCWPSVVVSFCATGSPASDVDDVCCISHRGKSRWHLSAAAFEWAHKTHDRTYLLAETRSVCGCAHWRWHHNDTHIVLCVCFFAHSVLVKTLAQIANSFAASSPVRVVRLQLCLTRVCIYYTANCDPITAQLWRG